MDSSQLFQSQSQSLQSFQFNQADTLYHQDIEIIEKSIDSLKPNWLECIFSSAKRKLRDNLGAIQNKENKQEILGVYNKAAFEYEKDTNFKGMLGLPKSVCDTFMRDNEQLPWVKLLQTWKNNDPGSGREEFCRRIVSAHLTKGSDLNLEGCNLGRGTVLPKLTDDEGNGPFANVKHINLANNKIDLSSLSGFLGDKKTLDSLSLRSCGVTDEGVKNLKLPGDVKQLSLAHNELKDINSIGKLKGKNIHTLFLNHNKFEKIVPDDFKEESNTMKVLRETMVLDLAMEDKFALKAAALNNDVEEFLNRLANDKDNEEGKPGGKEVRISWSLFGKQGDNQDFKENFIETLKLKGIHVAKDQKGKEMRNSYHVQFVIPKKEQNNL